MNRQKKIAGRTLKISIALIFFLCPPSVHAQGSVAASLATGFLAIASFTVLLLLALWLLWVIARLRNETRIAKNSEPVSAAERLGKLNEYQVTQLVQKASDGQKDQTAVKKSNDIKLVSVAFLVTCCSLGSQAKAVDDPNAALASPGMAIMVILVLVPLIGAIIFAVMGLKRVADRARYLRLRNEAIDLARQLEGNQALMDGLAQRKQALDFSLNNTELAGEFAPDDKKGLLHYITEVESLRFIAPKRKAAKRHDIDPSLVRLILWYLGSATFWLIFGTTIGEYLGIKFVSPDFDHVSWLSFGRLRPVHTNMVFWGWSSLAMLGLGYYVVATVSNAPVYSVRNGYRSLVLLNAAVVIGSLLLMAGINNGGGEYREYTWPIMGLFAAGIIITLFNYLKTIATRKTAEIYISNWYIIAAVMFLVVIVVVGYAPWWQDGLGETIVQGFYMHQAVGMWFMLFSLGLVYYFLPQQLNTPIYSYSLGILAFWSQILFYTLIGTHHFIFSSIPWWLQTVAIVGSMGMLIPVFSGTTNFLMTMRGNFHKVTRSYTLPFYLTGIIFYFTGSAQGTAEAFRATNLVWHFTDFTVAHSHLTMYGIIAFLLWGCIYTLVPRLTGKEPRQGMVGAHFWMALIGLLFYTIPLMIGSTIKGMGWVAGKPFIDGVVMMAPYWLWRAIGGSLMWGSHLVFAWNMYAMVAVETEAEVKNKVYRQLKELPENSLIDKV